MSIHDLAVRGAGYMARELDIDSRRESRLAFGLELILGEILKFICLLLLAWLLGILPEVLVLSLAAMILRLASGGAHCSEYYRCLIGGTLCFLLLGGAAQALTSVMNKEHLILTAGVSFILCAAALWRYAPGDNVNKPITSAAEKKKFKCLSLIIASGYGLTMPVLANFHNLSMFVLPLALGMVEQSFTVTPRGYRFIHWVDRILSLGRGSDTDDGNAHPGG